MKNRISNRQAICEALVAAARNDPDIVVLTSDSRGSAGLGPFAEAYPGRMIEVGIAEQNVVGIAAGLAASGKKPIVASPACFLSARSAEQVKVDVAYSQTPVLLLGISGGISYGALGMTHHSLQDIAFMRALPGIDILLPADRFESVSMLKDWLRNPRPAYMRIGRNAGEDVYEDGETRYAPGKATVLHEGGEACVIAAGETVRFALDAAVRLEGEGIGVRVINMHTIKPFDTGAVLDAARLGFILTMEEHSVFGGLGGAVCEIVCQNSPVPVRILGIPDEPAVAGNSAQVFQHYGLTCENATSIIRSEIKSSR